jgi:hypothetical protein
MTAEDGDDIDASQYIDDNDQGVEIALQQRTSGAADDEVDLLDGGDQRTETQNRYDDSRTLSGDW